MNVTRPLLPVSGVVTRADLQTLNDITVALESSDQALIRTDLLNTLGPGMAGPNYFRNAGLDLWTLGTTPATCAVGVRQTRADDWWTRTGATTTDLPTYERVTSGEQKFLYGAKLVGAAGVGLVDFGQDIAPRLSTALVPAITVTFTINNNTGDALVPLVRLDTCDTLESYGTATNRASVAAASIAAGAIVTQSVTLTTNNGATPGALRNGSLIYLRFPSGALDSTGKFVRITALKCEPGPLATENVVARDAADDTQAGQLPGASLELSISAGASASLLTVTDPLGVIFREKGVTQQRVPVAVTIDASTTGANGMDAGPIATGAYYVWLISSSSTVTGLLSLSDTAPTLPTGTLYKERVGWVWYNGTNFADTLQRGRSVRYASRASGLSIALSSTGYVSLRTLASAAADYLRPFFPTFAARAYGDARFVISAVGSTVANFGVAAGTTGIGADVVRFTTAGALDTARHTFSVPLMPGAADIALLTTTGVGGILEFNFTGFDF